MKKVLVCGAGGFIGNHMVDYYKALGYWVRGIDIKHPEFNVTNADEFIMGDLRDPDQCCMAVRGVDNVFQLAADMGGAGYIFTGENDAIVMHNSAVINLNIMDALMKYNRTATVFFSSSACVYAEHNQLDPDNPNCEESSAYPAAPDSEYGWEKLFSERMYAAFKRNFNINTKVARFHNVYGTLGSWNDGKEKAPAALCRKVAMAKDGEFIEVWGDGKQTRSFTFIDDALHGVNLLVNSHHEGPVNIGSSEMITINDLAQMVIDISGKDISIKNIPGPLGVRGRTSDNDLIKSILGWAPSTKLIDGMSNTYRWIEKQVMGGRTHA